MDNIVARVLAEYFGTGTLAFAISCTGLTIYGGLTIPYILAGSILSFAHVSGAHFNPAVSLGCLIVGKLSILEFFVYLAFQVMGSISGGKIADFLENVPVAYPQVADGISSSSAFFCEFIFTAGLVYVVLCMAVTSENSNKMYVAIAVSSYLSSAIISTGSVSGACLNPAIGLLQTLHDKSDDVWIYWTAPFLGSVLATLMFTMCYPQSTKTLRFIPSFIPDFLHSLTFFCHPIAIIMQELIGTFYLTLSVAFSVGSTDSIAPLGISNMLCAMVYAGGSVSGAHYNPAVSLAMYIRCSVIAAVHDSDPMIPIEDHDDDVRQSKTENALLQMDDVSQHWNLLGISPQQHEHRLVAQNMENEIGSEKRRSSIAVRYTSLLQKASFERIRSFYVYASSQLVGALFGALVASAVLGPYSHGRIGVPLVADGVDNAKAVFSEFVGTFLLVLTVLSLACTSATAGNQFFGLLIGFTLGSLIMALGSVSGGAFNPAFGLALPLVIGGNNDNGNGRDNCWVYLVGPFLGAIFALTMFGSVNPAEVGYKIREKLLKPITDHSSVDRRPLLQT